MFFSTIVCLIIFISTTGYAYLFKKIIYRDKTVEIFNHDIFLGVFFITFISFLINFFFPLKYFSIFIIIIGFVFFIYGFKNKIYQFKIFYYFVLLFLINFISFYNGPNVDSPMYHLQVVKWMNSEKINLGIINLEVLFALNSSWHSFLALMDISNKFVSAKYYLSSIIFSIIIYEIIYKKKIQLSDVYLFLSISFLLTFSLIHPNVNGPILNHLGNPEVDIVAMFFYFYTLYFFLKLMEENQKKNIIFLLNIFTILIFLSISIKLSNASLILLLIFIIIKNKNYKIFSFANFIVFAASISWFLKNFLISGCLIHPLKITCINTAWTNIALVDQDAKIIQSFARDTRLRDKYRDFDFFLESNDWFLPWFNDYFLNTSLLKISSILFLISFFTVIFLFFYRFFLKKNKKINHLTLLASSFFILSGYIWLKAPEIRFGSGFIISLPCFFIALAIYNLLKEKYLNFSKIKIATMVLLLLLSTKHFPSFKLEHLVQNNRNYNYNYNTDIIKIGTFNGVDIYQSTKWECGDFSKICVNRKKNNYKIINRLSYRIFLSDNNKK